MATGPTWRILLGTLLLVCVCVKSDSKPSPAKGRRDRRKPPEKTKKKAKRSETPERSQRSTKTSEKSQKYKSGSLEKSKKLEKSHRPTEPSSMQKKLLELAYGESAEASKNRQSHKDRDKSRKPARDEGLEVESDADETVYHKTGGGGHDHTQHRENSRRQKRHQEVESSQLGDSDQEKTHRRGSRKENIEIHNRKPEGHGSGSSDRTKDASTGSEKRKKHEERSAKRHRDERIDENCYEDNDTGDGPKRKERNDAASHKHRNGADSPEDRSHTRQKRRHGDGDRNARREH